MAEVKVKFDWKHLFKQLIVATITVLTICNSIVSLSIQKIQLDINIYKQQQQQIIDENNVLKQQVMILQEKSEQPSMKE